MSKILLDIMGVLFVDDTDLLVLKEHLARINAL